MLSLSYTHTAHHKCPQLKTSILLFFNDKECKMDNYIVRSYRDIIVVTKITTKRTRKAQSIVML